MTASPIYKRITGNDAPEDAVTVAIFYSGVSPVGITYWAPNPVEGYSGDEPTNIPQPVPDAFQETEEARRRRGLARIVVALEDALKWNGIWLNFGR